MGLGGEAKPIDASGWQQASITAGLAPLPRPPPLRFTATEGVYECVSTSRREGEGQEVRRREARAGVTHQKGPHLLCQTT